MPLLFLIKLFVWEENAIKLLTLIENTSASEKLYTEHGLSFYIEHKGNGILFDTGASGLFAKNASRMLVNLETLKAAVISHNHNDHTGGLETLFNICPKIKVFAKKAVLGSYLKKTGIFRIPIGQSRDYFERRIENFVLFNKFQEVVEGVYLVSNEVFEKKPEDKTLLMKKIVSPDSDEKAVPDDFEHELFMVVFPTNEPEDGFVVISSCSHSGVVNILKTARLTWPNSPMLGFVGGMHFCGSKKNLICSVEEIEEIANEIRDLDIGQIYVNHCTGQRGYERLKIHLGDQVQYLHGGEELEF